MKTASFIVAGMLALGGLTACDKQPEPAASWAPGQIMPPTTVKSKQLIHADPDDPRSEVECFEVVLEWSARTERYCVTEKLWERAQPGKLMNWD